MDHSIENTCFHLLKRIAGIFVHSPYDKDLTRKYAQQALDYLGRDEHISKVFAGFEEPLKTIINGIDMHDDVFIVTGIIRVQEKVSQLGLEWPRFTFTMKKKSYWTKGLIIGGAFFGGLILGLFKGARR